MTDRKKVRPTVRTFITAEDGAVTVDWIVLTAALVFMGIAAAYYVSSAVPELADALASFMNSFDVGGDPTDL